jgi:hypothetical protein
MWTQSHCRRAARRPPPKLVRGAAAAYLHGHRAGASEALIQSSFFMRLSRPGLPSPPHPEPASCSGTPHASRATPRGTEPSPRLFHAQKALHRPYC